MYKKKTSRTSTSNTKDKLERDASKITKLSQLITLNLANNQQRHCLPRGYEVTQWINHDSIIQSN